MEDKEFYKILVQRYLSKQLTDNELEVFAQLAKEGKLDEYFLSAMNEEAGIAEADENDYNKRNKVRPLFYKIAAAAVVLIALSAGLYSYFNKPVKLSDLKSIYAKHDADPGGNKATLTLADGSKISLTDASNGQIAQQAGVKITKNANGQLVYTIAESGKKEIDYNTINTPRGGEYQINLPDGTKVWLNAASSVTFPTSFANAKNRKIKLTGEAYFEVFKNKNLPFIVVTDKQEVEVLGTHFNINSYEDEKDTRTTLLEGSVQVRRILHAANQSNIAIAHDNSKILKPGQQSRVSSQPSKDISVEVANITQVMAWKNGYFHFENDNLLTVMNQLSRWYDIQVVYEVNRTDDEFVGDIPRNVKLSEVLKVLTYGGGLHFKIQERKLIITK
nr:FecR family protein [Pedobacter panaciterrae]